MITHLLSLGQDREASHWLAGLGGPNGRIGRGGGSASKRDEISFLDDDIINDVAQADSQPRQTPSVDPFSRLLTMASMIARLTVPATSRTLPSGVPASAVNFAVRNVAAGHGGHDHGVGPRSDVAPAWSARTDGRSQTANLNGECNDGLLGGRTSAGDFPNILEAANAADLSSAKALPPIASLTSPELICDILLARATGVFSQRHFSTSTRSLRASTDVPDFSPYMAKSPNTNRTLQYFMVGSMGLLAASGAKSTVTDILANMSASADVLALAKIEVEMGAIPEGKNLIVKWRGKPVFIRHRTADEIDEANKVDVKSLRDPQKDEDRVQRPEWLVMLGVCTHLGCVPIGEAGDFGGWFCPCHGSHYDISGRIRKGPAPVSS